MEYPIWKNHEAIRGVNIIERKYHLICDIINSEGYCENFEDWSKNNLVDSSTKDLPQKAFSKHVDEMCVKVMNAWL